MYSKINLKHMTLKNYLHFKYQVVTFQPKKKVH